MRLGRLPHIKKIALLWVFTLIFQIAIPTAALALTSGPSQPEVQSFEPVGTSEMVDLFSGDFNYNIPLLEVGGYPINLAYHAGVGMEDEASWVGLGWNLNPGAINRNMRGLPDEFAGDPVVKELHIKDNVSTSIFASASAEFVGWPLSPTFSHGIRFNSYKGVSLATSVSVGLDLITVGAFNLNGKLGIGFDSGEGIDISPSLGMSYTIGDKTKKGSFTGNLNIGAPYNSRQGLQELNYRLSFEGTYMQMVRGEDKKYKKTLMKAQSPSSSGSMISFNTPSYVTESDYDRSFLSFSLNGSVGPEVALTYPRLGLEGSYSRASTEGNKILRAYGYMNHHRARSSTDLLDFNREKDGPFFKSSGTLPLTNLTFDTYSVAGQGIGGAYRPYQNSIGHIYDSEAKSTSVSLGAGLELASPTILGFLNSFKGGGSLMAHVGSGNSGDWIEHNEAAQIYSYNDHSAVSNSTIEQSLYEPSYYKKVGELSVNNSSYDELAQDAPLALRMKKEGNKAKLEHTFIKEDENRTVTITPQNRQIDRTTRNQNLYSLTGKEASYVGLLKKVQNYEPGLSATTGRLVRNESDIGDHLEDLRFIADSDTPMTHHPYEMRVNRSDGMRYIYGLPFYNVRQHDVSFNADETIDRIFAEQLVAYTSDDASLANDNGDSEFYNREILPPYIYAHGLTAVLSPDYSDLMGDGPTNDDYGSWVKFNYTCAAGPRSSDHRALYNWRYPYASTTFQANFSEGFKSKIEDDKGNYQFGSKELWYNHSIESRSHIAVFITSGRDDAQGVDNAVGGSAIARQNEGPMQKLDEIRYYAKNDLERLGDDAIPIKTVHFDYNYELCPGVPNNRNNNANSSHHGKLTLKSVYFTYGNSIKGEYSKYNFSYFNDTNGDDLYTDADQSWPHENPPYNRKAQDRWGNYQEELDGACQIPQAIVSCDGPLSNSDFPYTRQGRDASDESLADLYAQAWSLKRIDLPSGGTINVQYEADDYAYVQDEKAGQMFTLVGTSQRAPESLSDCDPSHRINEPGLFLKHLVFELDENISTNDAIMDKAIFDDTYLGDMDLLYFRCLVDLKDGHYEYVPGYSKFINSGVFNENGTSYGWIELQGVGHKNSGYDVNPIAKAAWQFARLNMSELVHPNYLNSSVPGVGAVTSLIGMLISEVPRMVEGLNKNMGKNDYGSRLVPDKSYIRLQNPRGFKKGGGCRVRSVTISDNWNAISGAQDAIYGQQYMYTTTSSDFGGSNRLISSGVASYEPMLGGDELPFRTPITHEEHRFLAPDNSHYVEKPIGESLFPGANVGYSKVIVANIRPDFDIQRTGTGFSRSEFYTAKDFPYHNVKHNTKVHPIEYKPDPIERILKFAAHEFMHASQGYSVVLNDMHGKLKSTKSFGGFLPLNQNGDLELNTSIVNREDAISGMTYFYKLDEEGKLDNRVNIVTPQGDIENKIIGVESEMALDFRSQESKAKRADVQFQLDLLHISLGLFNIWIPPITSPPNLSSNHTLFRSSVATKLVNHHGLVDKVQAFNEGAIVETQNLLYDEITGDVLLTSVNNEYQIPETELDAEDNRIYGLQYPAHWAYDGMGPSAQNIGAEAMVRMRMSGEGIGALLDSDGGDSTDPADLIFQIGDEVLATRTLIHTLSDGSSHTHETNKKLWIFAIDYLGVTLIDEDGIFHPQNPPTDNEYEYGNWKLKVIRSGHRNQQSTPIASLTSLKNPANYIFDGIDHSDDNGTVQAEELEVLDFSAQTFDDRWQTYCRDQSVMSSECVCTEIGISSDRPNGEISYVTRIGNYLNQLFNNGELWTTRATSTNISDNLPWINCEPNSITKSTDLSHIRKTRYEINNIIWDENNTDVAGLVFNCLGPNLMSYTLKDGDHHYYEVLFYTPESDPSNSTEDYSFVRYTTPQNLPFVPKKLIRINNSSSENSVYALISNVPKEEIPNSNYGQSHLLVFDQENIHYSKVLFINANFQISDIISGISENEVILVGKDIKAYIMMKINVLTGSKIWTKILDPHPAVGNPRNIDHLQISNVGSDRYVMTGSGFLHNDQKEIFFMIDFEDSGTDIDINVQKVYSFPAGSNEFSILPTDSKKVNNLIFFSGKTSDNNVFIYRYDINAASGEFGFVQMDFDIKDVKFDINGNNEFSVVISPQISSGNSNLSQTVNLGNMDSQPFDPYVSQVAEMKSFDANSFQSTPSRVATEFSECYNGILWPNLQVDPILNKAKLSIGNLKLGDNNYLSTLSPCFDEGETSLVSVAIDESDINWKTGDYGIYDVNQSVVSEPYDREFIDQCCPSEMTHFLSGECDCEITFTLPEDVDYCLMDLIPTQHIHFIPTIFVRLHPDMLDFPDCETTVTSYIATFQVDDPLSEHHGEVVDIQMESDCWDVLDCEEIEEEIACGGDDGSLLNPFIQGLRGNWRPTTSYVHKSVPRQATQADEDTDIANHGYYTEYDQFWKKPLNSQSFWSTNDDNYIASSTTTIYSPYGEALESKDALDIYSAAILGYDKKLAIAAGANTRYHEMAFDGFEEYDFYERPTECHSRLHIDILDGADPAAVLDQNTVHTGLYSLKVGASEGGHQASIAIDCLDGNNPATDDRSPYDLIRCEDCLPEFGPKFRTEQDAENRYVFDCWIHQDDADGGVTITMKDASDVTVGTPVTFVPENHIIEGWQRIYKFFELVPGATSLEITFNNPSGTDMYVDDIRMYPFDANMRSFVYHPAALKLMAELDENNHATFYEYDEEWNLIRVKKETERGIVTLQENRSNVRLVR